eukprot:7802484-Pyramimonas_sp.AAC.1
MVECPEAPAAMRGSEVQKFFRGLDPRFPRRRRALLGTLGRYRGVSRGPLGRWPPPRQPKSLPRCPG